MPMHAGISNVGVLHAGMTNVVVLHAGRVLNGSRRRSPPWEAAMVLYTNHAQPLYSCLYTSCTYTRCTYISCTHMLASHSRQCSTA